MINSLMSRNSFFNPFNDSFFSMTPFTFLNNNIFNSFSADMTENDKEYNIEAELPGMKKEDINIDFKNDVLSIIAKNEKENEKKDDNGHILCSERTYGSFSRYFKLPNVEADNIKANYENGILKITLPKKEIEENKSKSHIEIE